MKNMIKVTKYIAVFAMIFATASVARADFYCTYGPNGPCPAYQQPTYTFANSAYPVLESNSNQPTNTNTNSNTNTNYNSTNNGSYNPAPTTSTAPAATVPPKPKPQPKAEIYNTVKAESEWGTENPTLAASVASARGNFLPNSFIEWLGIIVLVFTIVFTARYLYNERQKQKELKELQVKPA